QVLPQLTVSFQNLTAFIIQHRDQIVKGISEAVSGVIEALKGIDWKGLFTTIRDLALTANDFAQAIGGWQNALIGFLALQFGPRLLSLAGAFTTLGAAIVTTPIGWIAAIAAAGAWIAFNWDKVWPVIDRVSKALGIDWGAIGATVKAAFDAVVGAVHAV